MNTAADPNGPKSLSVRKETDSLGEIEVPADKLWGAETQRALEHFNVGRDPMPPEMISAYAMLKRGRVAGPLPLGLRVPAPRVFRGAGFLGP